MYISLALRVFCFFSIFVVGGIIGLVGFVFTDYTGSYQNDINDIEIRLKNQLVYNNLDVQVLDIEEKNNGNLGVRFSTSKEGENIEGNGYLTLEKKKLFGYSLKDIRCYVDSEGTFYSYSVNSKKGSFVDENKELIIAGCVVVTVWLSSLVLVLIQRQREREE